ncbi:semaphorin-4A [Trichomycterus rosablanca]|uniref:semaphorin-4A n=1 Tax=Trichomycterus rosablanca TaxID=2290929 RepID=UPI002F356C05
MASTLALLLSAVLAVLIDGGVGGHVVPRVTFPLDSPGRSFTLFTLPDVENTTTLLLSRDEGTLFVGARDAVLALGVSAGGGLQLGKKLDWSPTEGDIDGCVMKGKDRTDCQNYVRVLQALNSTHMFTCGTFGFSPKCSYMNSEEFSLVTGPGGKPEEGRGRCPYDPFQKNTAITVGGELYTATVADYRSTRPVISRHLSEGNRVDLKLDDNVGLLEEPTFISSTFIPSEEKVYFFFSEFGREYDFIDRFTVSRVAQVCTSDVGGERTLQKRWTTFTKAQLLCQAGGELPYNVLQDVTTLPPAAGASPDETLFYGIFSSQWSVNSGSSAVCVFSLGDVKAVFSGNYKVLNKSTLKWSSSVREKITNPGECGLHNASDNALRFVKENFLADKSVLPAGQAPALVSPNERYSNIVAQRVQGAGGREYTVLYLLTESGFLHKAVVLRSGAHIVEEIQVFKQPQLVQNLVLSVSKGAVLVGSSEGVVSVPVANCSYYWSCAECVLARDPFCGWDPTRLVCAQISSIERNAVQDVAEGKVPKECNSPPVNPRARSSIKNPTGIVLPVTLNEVVNLRCPSSSRLARLHWERPGGRLSPSVYIQQPDSSLGFLATPDTLGTYACLAEENGSTQTLAVYEVTRKVDVVQEPSTISTTTTIRIPHTTPPATTQTGASTATPEPREPRLVGISTVEGTTYEMMKDLSLSLVDREAEKQLPETRPSYLRELVAVSVLLALCFSVLLLMTLYNLRKSCRGWTASRSVTPGGATPQERQVLRQDSVKLEKENGPSNGAESPSAASGGAPNGSNGHLPNIST